VLLLVVGLIIALFFSWFRPMAHLTTVLGYRMLHVFVLSWSLSALGGLATAILLAVAAARFAVLLLAVGFGAMLLAGLFLFIAGKTVFGAVHGAFDALTGGAGGEQLSAGLRWSASAGLAGAALATGGVGALGSAATGLRQQIGQTAGGWSDTALAYAAARGTGNSPTYAATYALSRTHARPLARLNALSAAFGTTPDDVERASYLAATAGHSDPLSPRAIAALRRDGAKAQRGQPAAPPTQQHGSQP
jgi:hypothetical protein